MGTLKKSTLKTGVTIEFRIQKVSRRKDNQRFTVQLSVTDSTTIVPIFTRPITVLSKRKIPARLRNDPEAIALYKAEKLHRAQNKLTLVLNCVVKLIKCHIQLINCM